MSKRLIALLAVSFALVGGVLLFKSSGAGAEILWNASNGGTWLLPLVVVASLVDSINPCAFSILILTIAFLFNLGRPRAEIFKIGGVYILGIFAVYILIGLGILQTLHLFNTPHFMAKVGSALLILFGLINLINEFFPAFPVKLSIPQAAHRKIAEFMNQATIPAAFILGALVGLCEFPCTGGPYLMVLGLLHDQSTFLSGFGYLVLYNLIFVLPLVVILLMASDKAVVEKVSVWRKTNTRNMRLYGGLAMVALGILVLLV